MLLFYPGLQTNCYILLPLFQSDLPSDPDASFESHLSAEPADHDAELESDLSVEPGDPDASFESHLSAEPADPDAQLESDLSVEPALDESSLAESPTANVRQNLSSSSLTFQVINDCTNKGRPKLLDSRGYSYGIKRRRANATDWVCTIRPKVNISD